MKSPLIHLVTLVSSKSRLTCLMQVILLFVAIASTKAQESTPPNQITLWNPYDLKFTPDNKYLVVTSPNDTKVWNLSTLTCLSVKPSFYRDVVANNNSWSYLADTNSFYFHQSANEDEIYHVSEDGNSWNVIGALGKEDYRSYRFDDPPSYLLNSNTLLVINTDKMLLPHISVQQLNNPKELIHEKIVTKNNISTANRNFTVLKGEANLYYLLSFRRAPKAQNGEGVVTEINLNTHRTRVLTSGIEVYVGDNSDTFSRFETLKRSFETPGFVVLNLDGFIYAVRKSDNKVLANNDITSKFPPNSYPKICGERDGKLVTYSFDTGEKRGFVFHTLDFDTQSPGEPIFHFDLDLLALKNFRIALSRNGKEIAIAYQCNEDPGYKVAYLNAQKMTMLRDSAHTVENFLAEQAIVRKENELIRQQKEKEAEDRLQALQHQSRELVVAREWYGIISRDNNREGFGLQLSCDAAGNITGLYEYQGASGGSNYSIIYHVSGSFISENTFVINMGSIYAKTNNLNEAALTQKSLHLQIMINPQTRSDYLLYCKEYGGSFQEGNLDKHFFQ